MALLDKADKGSKRTNTLANLYKDKSLPEGLGTIRC
jgi:hypothetical protein